MKLTKESIDSCRTPGGSFTNETARFLGAKLPLVHGWPDHLIGRDISDADFTAAKSARFIRRAEDWFHKSEGQMGLPGMS